MSNDLEPREHPVVNLFPPMTEEEYQALKADIEANGLHEPCRLWRGQLVDGRHRLRACRELGCEPRFVEVDGDEAAMMRLVFGMNWSRRHLSSGQKATVLVDFDDLLAGLARQAKDRQQAQGERGKEGGRGNKKTLPQQVGEGIDPHAREADQQAALLAGTNRQYVADARKLKAEAPHLLARVRAGEVTLRAAAAEHRREERRADIIHEVVLPAGPFRVIVADPPWEYRNRVDDATHRGACPYRSMSLEEIKVYLPPGLAHQDSVLWLWTTNAHMPCAFEVLRAWGFEHKTILTWVKDRMGLGDWLRGRTEHCLLAVRGRPLVTLTNQTTALDGPLRQHSRKPEEFYALVEALCPGSKVELFARSQRPGWVCHGNQPDAFP
jgi:N6-adenosine-specific RNA methylase IME4